MHCGTKMGSQTKNEVSLSYEETYQSSGNLRQLEVVGTVLEERALLKKKTSRDPLTLS